MWVQYETVTAVTNVSVISVNWYVHTAAPDFISSATFPLKDVSEKNLLSGALQRTLCKTESEMSAGKAFFFHRIN